MTEFADPVQRVGVELGSFESGSVAPRTKTPLFRFGVFELDVGTGELRKDGRLIHLRHQPVAVLRLLLSRAGELVTRHEITAALWPDDLDIDVEQGLNHCMKEIRAALGDRHDSPLFIQTLPRRGYRFLTEVHNLRESQPSLARAPLPTLVEPSPAPALREAVHEAGDSVATGVVVSLSVRRSNTDGHGWSASYQGRTDELEALERLVAAGLRAAIATVTSADLGESGENATPHDPRFE